MGIKILNEDTYKTFVYSERPEYTSARRKIKNIRLDMISHDKEYIARNHNKETFLINNPNFLDSDNRRTVGGIFSPYFGQDQMNPDSREYSCECNYLYGAVNEGKICPMCGQPVQHITPDLRKIAYIDIYPYHILTYHGYNLMKKHIKDLPELLNKVKKIDIKGRTVSDNDETLISLYEDYDDLYFDKIGIPKDKMFTTKIPVYTAILRPLIQKGISITMLDVNKAYQSINILARDLENVSHIKASTQILRILNKIQEDFIEICLHVDGQLKKKGGIFRKYGVTGRIDYCSRIVIKLNVDLKANEIDVPYQTFMVLYEEEITNMLMTLNNISLAKASNMYQLALNYRDETMVKIIEMLLKRNGGVWVLINRNPTISKHGIMYVRIRKINDSFNNYCMSVSSCVLAPLAADFDGDQLSLYAVKDRRFHEIYKRVFCPTYAFINRATGYFNDGMGLRKDYIAIVSSAWDIFNKLDEYINTPSTLRDAKKYELNIDTIGEGSISSEDYHNIVNYMNDLY